ncbi:MAG: hypothetical protein IKS39_04030 [Clostridia bacterium]|nr:hypothetical protein [Clostridia bacterium]
MNAKVNLYLPGEDEYAVPASVIYSEIAGRSEIAGAFKFASAGEAVKLAWKSAMRGENTIVVADAARFNKIKLLMLKAFPSKIEHSQMISGRVGDLLPADSRELKTETAVPAGAAVYPSQDGLRSGFSFDFRKGRVALLPLDIETVKGAIERGVTDFAAAEKGEADILRDCLIRIQQSGRTVGVSDFGLSKAVFNVSQTVGIDGSIFTPVEQESSPDGEMIRFAADAAKDARDISSSDYGIAISGVEDDGSITIALADENAARIEVIHAAEGEEKSQTAKAATVRLMELLAGSVDGGVEVPDLKPVRNSSKPLIAIIVCLAAAALICLGVGIAVFRSSVSRSKPASESTSADVITTEASVTDAPETELGDEFGEVVPVFEATYTDSAVFDEINTTYSGGGVRTNAANGQFTTDSSGIIENMRSGSTTLKVASTISGAISSLIAEIDSTTGVSSPEGESTTLADGSSTGRERSTRERTTRERITRSTTAATTQTASAEKTGETKGQGKFVFTCYGYGHGVGMSQRGAIAYANKGWNCNQILTHYYQGTTLMVDKNTPAEVTRQGVKMTLVAFLCRTVKPEIGHNSPYEALKAQAIAAYTFGMYNSFNSNQAFDPYFSYKGTQVEKAVFDVLHIKSEDEQPHAVYVSYNGKYANTVYCASVAGKTASSRSVWGMSLPYLNGGVTSPETVEISTAEFTVERMRTLIRAVCGDRAELNNDPSTWLKILYHDGAYSNSIGYVDQINVCGVAMSGNNFREKLLGRSIKSECFTIKYVRFQ